MTAEAFDVPVFGKVFPYQQEGSWFGVIETIDDFRELIIVIGPQIARSSRADYPDADRQYMKEYTVRYGKRSINQYVQSADTVFVIPQPWSIRLD